MSVTAQFRSVSIEKLRLAFTVFLESRQTDPKLPSPSILEGDIKIVTNDLGMMTLYIGGVSFGFSDFAKSANVIAVATYPSDDGLGNTALKCVFAVNDEGGVTLNKYDTTFEETHL